MTPMCEGQTACLAPLRPKNTDHAALLPRDPRFVPVTALADAVSVGFTGSHIEILERFERGQRRLHELGLPTMTFQRADQAVDLREGVAQ